MMPRKIVFSCLVVVVAALTACSNHYEASVGSIAEKGAWVSVTYGDQMKFVSEGPAIVTGVGGAVILFDLPARERGDYQIQVASQCAVELVIGEAREVHQARPLLLRRADENLVGKPNVSTWRVAPPALSLVRLTAECGASPFALAIAIAKPGEETPQPSHWQEFLAPQIEEVPSQKDARAGTIETVQLCSRTI
jgi:hypothetical protein